MSSAGSRKHKIGLLLECRSFNSGMALSRLGDNSCTQHFHLSEPTFAGTVPPPCPVHTTRSRHRRNTRVQCTCACYVSGVLLHVASFCESHKQARFAPQSCSANVLTCVYPKQVLLRCRTAGGTRTSQGIFTAANSGGIVARQPLPSEIPFFDSNCDHAPFRFSALVGPFCTECASHFCSHRPHMLVSKKKD